MVYAAVRFAFAALWFVGLVSVDALHDKATLQELIPNVCIETRTSVVSNTMKP